MQNHHHHRSSSSSEVLAAALENRAGEIGLAFLDTRRGRLRLTQFIETSRCRTHVRSALRASGASVVLVPASSALAVAAAAAAAAVESGGGDGGNNQNQNQNQNSSSSVILLGLAAAVEAEGLSALPWPRSAFDDTKASTALQLCAGGWESARAVERAKYLSLGAAGALLYFLLNSRGSLPAEYSLSISFETSRDYLSLDSATVAALCLVSGGSGGGSGSGGGEGGGGGMATTTTSLFKALAPGARTDAGRSLLRASLLQPLAHAPTIAARHEAVAELASEAATSVGGGGSGNKKNNNNNGVGRSAFPVSTAGPRGDSVSCALRSLPRDLDRALGILSLRPCRVAGGGGVGVHGSGNGSNNNTNNLDSAKATAAAAAARVDSLARGLRTLRLALSSLPALAASLEGCSSSLLVAVRANVGHSTFSVLENLLRRVLEDDPVGAAAALRDGGAGFGGDDDDDDEEEEEEEDSGSEEEEEGEEFDDDDDNEARTAATRSARPPRQRRRRCGSRAAAGQQVPLPRPPEPTRSAYSVRSDRGGLLEAAREALSAAAACAAAEAGEVRALGGGDGNRRGRSNGRGQSNNGSGSGLSAAWCACLSKAKLSHTTRKGFVVVLPKAPSSSSSSSSSSAAALRHRARSSSSSSAHFHLPAGLSLVSVRPRGGAIEVSTPALAALNARAAAALADCLLLSEQALEVAAAACLEHADFLHRLVDNVALVDALQAFAAWARAVRRKHGDGGEASVAVPRLVGPREPLALGGLRCALLESASLSSSGGGGEVVPNDAYLALMGGGRSGGSGGKKKKKEGEEEKEEQQLPRLGCLHVVSGPNSGGKSTYLRAIGLAVVLSQAGGLPPARVACLPVLERLSLVAAGGNGDGGNGGGVSSSSSSSSSAINCGLRALASSAGFAEEAANLAHVIEDARRAAPGRALVLLDEPGRGTSAADGAPLAWAAAEAISASKRGGQRCVVATHHPLLSEMEGCYAFARSWHLVAECRRRGGGRGGNGGGEGAQQQNNNSNSNSNNSSLLLLPPLLRFAWKLAPGPCPVRHYGLALAPSVGIPKRVVAAAAAVASAIEGEEQEVEVEAEGEQEEQEKFSENSPSPPPAPSLLTSAQRSLLEAAHRLRCLAVALKAGADEGAVAAALSELRREAAGALREAEEAGMEVEEG